MAKSHLLPPSFVLTVAALIAACSGGAGGGLDGGGGGAPPQGDNVTPGAFLPTDGLIVVEFESGDAAGDWADETSLAGFTGSSYLTWTGANLYSNSGVDAFGFDFWIEDAGTYAFRIHNRHDHPDSTLANDAWVRMDGGDWVKTFSWQRGQWTWATNHEFSSTNKPEASYVLSRGNHRIEFSGRSADFSMDRFHLYDASVVDPLSTNHPESARTAATSALVGSSGADVGWITADPELTSLLRLDTGVLGLEANPRDSNPRDSNPRDSVRWSIPGAVYADGTSEESAVPVILLEGGVAVPVAIELGQGNEAEHASGVVQVEGAPARVVGPLRAGTEVELRFAETIQGRVEFESPAGAIHEAEAVTARSGSRATLLVDVPGLWRYRVIGPETGGAFRVLP